MTDKTPLEKLDDAIHEFMRETTPADWNGVVSSWVVGVETTAINSDPELGLPLMDAQHYASGPATTTGTALGLARYVAGVYETHMVRTTLDQDD